MSTEQMGITQKITKGTGDVSILTVMQEYTVHTPEEGQKDENDDELFTIMKKVKPHTEVCDMKSNKSNVLLKNLQLI